MDTTEAPQAQLLYTLREAAALLSMSVDTVRRRIAAAEIATVRIGGKVRIERTELEDLIRRCRVPAGAAP